MVGLLVSLQLSTVTNINFVENLKLLLLADLQLHSTKLGNVCKLWF